MRTRTVLFVGVLSLGATIQIASALPNTADIHVRTIGKRPGCEFTPEGAIEVYNSNRYAYYKVHVQGTYKNTVAGPDHCSGGSPDCSRGISFDKTLEPCADSGNFCGSESAWLPNGEEGCTGNSCDNPTSTCPTSGGWCTFFPNLLVKITYYSEDGTTWTPADETVCARGSYGSSPECAHESFCPNHQSIRQPCYFTGWNTWCLDSE